MSPSIISAAALVESTKAHQQKEVKKRPSHADLAVASTIAAALKNSSDHAFAEDAVNLLNEMTSSKHKNSEPGLNADNLKLKEKKKKTPPPPPPQALIHPPPKSSPLSPKQTRMARVRRLSKSHTKLSNQEKEKLTLISPLSGLSSSTKSPTQKSTPPSPSSPKESRMQRVRRLSAKHGKISLLQTQTSNIPTSNSPPNNITCDDTTSTHPLKSAAFLRPSKEATQDENIQQQISELESMIRSAKMERSSASQSSKQSTKTLKQVESMLNSSPPPSLSKYDENLAMEEREIKMLSEQLNTLETVIDQRQQRENEHNKNVDNQKYSQRSVQRSQKEFLNFSNRHCFLQKQLIEEERNVDWMKMCWSSAAENLSDAADAMKSSRSSNVEAIAEGVQIASESMADVVKSLKKKIQLNEVAPKKNAISTSTLRRQRDELLSSSTSKYATLVDRVSRSIQMSRDRDDEALSTRYDEFARQMTVDCARQNNLAKEADKMMKKYEKERQRKLLLERQLEKLKEGSEENIRLFKKTKLEQSKILDGLLDACDAREGQNGEIETENMLVAHRKQEESKYQELLEILRMEYSDKLKQTKQQSHITFKVASQSILNAIEAENMQVFEEKEETLKHQENSLSLQQIEIQNMETLLAKHQETLIMANKRVELVDLANLKQKTSTKMMIRQCKLDIQKMWKLSNGGLQEKCHFYLDIDRQMPWNCGQAELWSNEYTHLVAGSTLERMVPKWRQINRMLIFVEQLVNESKLDYIAASIMQAELESCGLDIPSVLVNVHHSSFVGAKLSSDRRRNIAQYKEELTVLPPQYAVLVRRKQEYESAMHTLLEEYKRDTGTDFMVVDQEHFVNTGNRDLMMKLKNILIGRRFADDGTENTDVSAEPVTSPTAQRSQRRASAVMFASQDLSEFNVQHYVSDDGFVFAQVIASDYARFVCYASIKGRIDTTKCLLRLSQTAQEKMRNEFRGQK